MILLFTKVRNPRRSVDEVEVRAVELARRVLSDGAAQPGAHVSYALGKIGCCDLRSTRIDRDVQKPKRLILALDRHLDKIRTLILDAEQAVVGEVGDFFPVDQVLRRVEADGIKIPVARQSVRSFNE